MPDANEADSKPVDSGEEFFDEYFKLFAPLFEGEWRDQLHLFEHACCLIRPSGIQVEGWDPLAETTDLVEDLAALSRIELEMGPFAHPARTRARLALILYCHLTEVDFFYHLSAGPMWREMRDLSVC